VCLNGCAYVRLPLTGNEELGLKPTVPANKYQRVANENNKIKCIKLWVISKNSSNDLGDIIYIPKK
jgi:hypothetical protein